MENTELTTINFNQLSDWGLIYLINQKVLHPLGLALSRDPDNGTSNGALLDPSDDLMWEYTKELIDRNDIKLNYFLEHREAILKELQKSPMYKMKEVQDLVGKDPLVFNFGGRNFSGVLVSIDFCTQTEEQLAKGIVAGGQARLRTISGDIEKVLFNDIAFPKEVVA